MNEDEKNYYQANLDFNASLDSLAHYGVAGMRWGVRNADTLRKYNGAMGLVRRGVTTPLRQVTRIKRRLNVSAHARAGRAYQKKLERQQQKASSTLEKTAQIKESDGYKTKTKNPSKLSDQELRSANQRLQDEITYKQRQAQLAELNMTKNQRRIRTFKSDASTVGRTVIKNFATAQLSKALNNAVGSSNASKSAKKAKEKVDKTAEKTKERIFETVNNVSYNTQINNFYPPQSGSTKSKPKDVASTSYNVKSDTPLLTAGEEKKK